MILVRCDNVSKSFAVTSGYLRREVGSVHAVDGVTLQIERGRVYGLVGESGCGKTTLGRLILGVLKPDSGEVDRATEKMQAVFQDPYNSLDPQMRISDVLSEPLILAHDTDRMRERIAEALELVKLPVTALSKYPHQFSGGERQRIAIARSVLTRPELIVCDEPVSSLDVTIQLQVLKLLKEIRERYSITYLFISHDLRVVRYMCDSVAVMKQGRIVEEGRTDDVYMRPTHAYTRTLLASIPKSAV